MATKTKAKSKKKAKAKRAPRQVTVLKFSDKQLKKLKKRLYEVREHRGITRSDLAAELELSMSYFYQMENENTPTFLSLPALFRVCKLLKVSPAKFLKDIK